MQSQQGTDRLARRPRIPIVAEGEAASANNVGGAIICWQIKDKLPSLRLVLVLIIAQQPDSMHADWQKGGLLEAQDVADAETTGY